jgi:flagellar motor switch/type III secretory pathway protein FliN
MTEIRGLRGLRRHDPATNELSVAILRLLNGQSNRHQNGIEAALCDALPMGVPIFRCADGIFFCITDTHGVAQPNDDSDIEEACDALDAVDDHLKIAENALTLNLDPVDLTVNEVSKIKDVHSVYISISNERRTIYLSISNDHPSADKWINNAAKVAQPLGDLVLSAQLLLSGPKLPILQASNIAHGDMLLLGSRLAASICVLGVEPITGIFDMHSGLFGASAPLRENEIEEDMETDNDADAASRFGALQVPVTIRLPEQAISAADIANLQSGATLVLGPVVQGLIAELVVGGKALARGEIVQVGTDFALLVDDYSPVPSRAKLNTADDHISQPLDMPLDDGSFSEIEE